MVVALTLGAGCLLMVAASQADAPAIGLLAVLVGNGLILLGGAIGTGELTRVQERRLAAVLPESHSGDGRARDHALGVRRARATDHHHHGSGFGSGQGGTFDCTAGP